LQIFSENRPSPLQALTCGLLEEKGLRVFVKRDDLLHPAVSGNKWRKLKYNLLEARQLGHKRLLTFGGAYSNHLYATAAAGQLLGFETVGIIRGEDAAVHPSPTLLYAAACGMQLHYVTRQAYRAKDLLAQEWVRDCYIIPEGGTNELAIRGTAEIVPEIIHQLGHWPDYIACSFGTGGTATGLLQSLNNQHTKLLVFPALKVPETYVKDEISRWHCPTEALKVAPQFHAGGYGKFNNELLSFIRQFELRHGIPLEQVYTGKLAWGLKSLIESDFFSAGTSIVVLHSGGLQGRHPSLGAMPNKKDGL
jgi:1-aminocyclopropane-1-carboxylate deaminase/D-cysteine desulfhydrase-like pyridoxal-dependent ACC family enzyme